MESQQTCGRGLAEHSALPATISKLLFSLADNLEHHIPGLDLSDERSRLERDVYVSLAQRHRALAEQLASAAQAMASQRDLPMGKHNIEVLSTPEVAQAFERYLNVERNLLELLQNSVERDQAMLDRMSSRA